MSSSGRIYLTGFMGSGKSTVGPRVAAVLGYAFYDLDALIEARAEKPIPQLFAEEGEAAFRALEARVLRETARRSRVVFALGGGALADEDNLGWALAHGTVVYLRVPPAVLVGRLRAGQALRPLLCDARGVPLPPEALRGRVEALLARREPYYLRAHVVVDAGDLDAAQTVAAVLQALADAGLRD
ncbi:shikimate kinase [Rhodocaloribacter litoris]|uniref:shikimate kinase n=1 Tax=Rhodocaloribacter litoris TaxID=2558931 RepID=UPI00141DB30C|nr:shikimate kinase [Rhodocaloribacter litoris]QXD15073.1 shikimate kinase [Rhodocaloribacter litoris]GIV62132.1 MAG: shikimate kinase [Rhodothermaceae bacterium]